MTTTKEYCQCSFVMIFRDNKDRPYCSNCKKLIYEEQTMTNVPKLNPFEEAIRNNICAHWICMDCNGVFLEKSISEFSCPSCDSKNIRYAIASAALACEEIHREKLKEVLLRLKRHQNKHPHGWIDLEILEIAKENNITL